MPDEVVIKVDNVSKDFRLVHEKNTTLKGKFTSVLKGKGRGKSVTKQHALKNISFEVKKGEFFGIVGRNGSGKSTLLKILAEIYQPTKGEVHVVGKLVPFIELGVGFNPELTGRDNVYLNGAILGFSRTEIDDFYDEVVEFAELKEYMDKKLKNYSSGMQVRLAFSMAIRAKADILLIDEVLAVGDADFQRKCFEYFKQLKKYKKTVVFVSHDMNAIREYCDRALLIDDKKTISEGDANSIAAKYSKLFIDSFRIDNNEKNNEDRWGNKSIRFERITTSKKINSKDKEINILMRIKAINNVSSPIIGFMMENERGDKLLGTNTQIEGHKIRDLRKNEVISINWALPNILADGKYSLTVAALYDGGISIADWWANALIITCLRSDSTPYLTKLNINARISYEETL